MAKKSETAKRQLRITLDEDVVEKLSWVISAKGFKNESEYLNDLLKNKFEKISKKSTIEEIEKI
jgi:metal-responsive CopG/Arc/MetJ family transcriptional regulator